MKRDRRDGASRPCLKPTTQNPAAIVLARVAAGLEQQQLAAKIDVTKGYMSEIEKGTRSVPPPRLKAIADALGVETATLINPAIAEAAQQPYQDSETTEDDPDDARCSDCGYVIGSSGHQNACEPEAAKAA